MERTNYEKESISSCIGNEHGSSNDDRNVEHQKKLLIVQISAEKTIYNRNQPVC